MNKKAIFKIVGTVVAGAAIGWFAKSMLGGGGGGPAMGRPQMPPATVTVQTVRSSNLQPAEEYIAKVDPIEDVMIRSEVSGYIESVHFTEGSMVKKGDLLFTIDRRSYQASANAAEAELNRAQKLYERMKNADVRSISKSDMENAESGFLRAQAAYNLAKVSLDYTEIKAPVSGRIGAVQMTKGNYVTAASGALARIVQVDPIRVVFSQTDREYLALRRRELAGDAAALEAKVILPDGSVFPNIGKKDFDDNAINPLTGTIAVRYLFDNPNGLLLPGGYVTAQLSNPDGVTGIKIPLRSLLIDQVGAYVLTVDDAGVVGTLRVEAGDQIGPDIIILSGLTVGDHVVIDGIQKARPGAIVQVIEAHP